MKRSLIILLAVSLVIAGFVSWFASSRPDGLERVAEDLNFLESAEDSPLEVMPDYTVPGIKGFLSNGLSGVIGALAVFGLVMLIGKIMYRKNRRGDSNASSPH
ncbi:PDGLE domain-containing protein [Candidatus Latescibacterota bacterium]